MLKYSLMAFLMLSLAATGYGVGGAESYEGDFLGDGDVDGSDLARLIMGLNQLDLDIFAQQFGESGCLDEVIAFTFTTTAGQINTLPGAATSVRVTFNGETLTSASSPMTFATPAGAYTFTALALNGGTTVAAMGPISLTVVSGFPVTTPLAFTAFPAFDTYQTDVGLDTPNTLIYIGTANRDRIVQYGGAANDLLSASTGAGNDWIEQYGEGGGDQLIARCGSGDDYIFQKAGGGATTISADGAFGNDWIVVIGGSGDDTITVTGGEGDDVIQIESGDGDDSILVQGGNGTNTVAIDGGPGTDTLTVDGLPVLIQDSGLNVIYQSGVGGTTITVTGIEQITVNDAGGNPIFTWP
jgi:hypothetical protein